MHVLGTDYDGWDCLLRQEDSCPDAGHHCQVVFFSGRTTKQKPFYTASLKSRNNSIDHKTGFLLIHPMWNKLIRISRK